MKIAKTILTFLVSVIISYILFYYITSEFIYSVYSGSSAFIIPLICALFIAQTLIVFMIIRLIMNRTLDYWNEVILWIIYAFVMAVLLFGRPAIDYGASAGQSELNMQYVIQILLNMICFVPVGIAFRKISKYRMIMISVLMILCIELLQMATHRGVFDILDIIAGTIGISAGYAIANFVSDRHLNKPAAH